MQGGTWPGNQGREAAKLGLRVKWSWLGGCAQLGWEGGGVLRGERARVQGQAAVAGGSSATLRSRERQPGV